MLLICFCVVGVYISILDIKTGFLPRYVVVSATILVLLFQFFFSRVLFPLNVMGSLLGLTIFGLTWILTRKKLGLGDIWFAAFLGAVLGIPLIYPAFFVAGALALLVMLCKKQKKIPFTPFMFLGALTVLCINKIGNPLI